jgi:hypothetical protein
LIRSVPDISFSIQNCNSLNISTHCDKQLAKLIARGLYIGKYPPPPGGGEISAEVIWGKKYETVKRKRGKMKRKKKKGERKRKKGVRKRKKG